MKAESFLATTEEELIANAGTVYNQTLALGNLDVAQWEHKLPDKDWEDLSLALVGTPCEIEGSAPCRISTGTTRNKTRESVPSTTQSR